MIRLVLAEDHHLVRQGIRALLEKTGDFQILAEAEDGYQAVEFFKQYKPDVILMDINMPKLNGIQACQQLTALDAKIRVIMLSMYSDETLVRQALLAGASGYVLKNSLTQELVLAIKSALRGETYLSPGVSKVLLKNFRENEAQIASRNPLSFLTARETEVMQLIAEGNTTKAIAAHLGLSDKTIEKHRTSLMSKLNISDIAAVVRMAVKYGLIFLDE